MEHTTVKELVDKHRQMKSYVTDIIIVLEKMQDRNYDRTEVIERSRKDQRYPVRLIVQEYDRLIANLVDLENTPVRLLND